MEAVSGQPGTGRVERSRRVGRSRFARVIGVGAVVVAAALSLSSCAAGQHAATAIDKPAIAGTSGQVGSIELQNVSIQAPDVFGRATGQRFYTAGDAAPMTLTLVNIGHTTDTLTSVTSPAFTSWAIVDTADLSAKSGGATSQALAPNVALSLGLSGLGVGTGQSDQTLVLRGLTATQQNLYPGSAVNVTFTFANAGAITLRVPVDLTSTGTTASVAPPAGESAAE